MKERKNPNGTIELIEFIPQCLLCSNSDERWRNGEFVCKKYPNGISETILMNDKRCRKGKPKNLDFKNLF
jgi:hypothetical protein